MYYDCDAEPNFPEVEEIINEATDKFSAFLQEEFKGEYKSIAVAGQSLAARERMLAQNSADLDKKAKELQEREERLIASEAAQYDKFKSEWFKELGLAFDIGDTVFYYRDITQRAICPTCKGSKKLSAQISVDGVPQSYEVTCPTCEGIGTVKNDRRVYQIIEAKVIQIDAHICKRSDSSITASKSTFSGELLTRVWLRPTSGSDSTEVRGQFIYKTREECQEAINALQAKQ